MCGIAGYLSPEPHDSSIAERMASQIQSRGPDDAGVWLDAVAGVALAHRRLSILDLSLAGHQPMKSPSDQFVIVFNGEIYNHLEIRYELDRSSGGHNWRGHSDTETLLAGFDVWGIENTIKKAIGMFAFAVWDRQLKTLILGRDRLGEKPLYYGWQGNSFLFGSELKALKMHPDFKGEINRGAVCLLMRHNCIPSPYSIYKGISKLEPGCLLRVSSGQSKTEIFSYWSARDVIVSGVKTPFVGSPKQAVDELEVLAMDAIRQQMMADVPLGAFLSGGIDSSTVVALMQMQSTRPVKTFTIGFDVKGYNEAEHAKIVAKHLGTEHTELYVSADQAMAVIPRLPTLYDEPFSDSSQIPTFLISQLARDHVTVSLSGDAGDELFCGYNRYQITTKLWNKLSLFPVQLRSLAAKSITAISPKSWDFVAGMIPGRTRFVNFGDKLHKGADVLSSRSVDDLYLGLVSHHINPAALVIGGQEPSTLLTANRPDLNELSDVQRMMALDMMTYLPDDILVKVDRAAMGVSLETRVPFLDHRIVEFAWSLPQSIKVHDGKGKWPLRQVLNRHVPRELIDRPKMGFGIPLHDWLRGPLKNWAEALLNESRLHQEGIFYPEPIRKLWDEHQGGNRNWAYLLWDVLMFQSWMEAQST